MSNHTTEKGATKRGENVRPRSPQEARADLAKRLRERRSEIEQEIFTAACAVSDLARAQDAEYVVGLRAALAAALDFVLEGIELGEDFSGPVPSKLMKGLEGRV